MTDFETRILLACT